MWLLAARAADRASKQIRCRQGVLQLFAMVTTQAPPAVPDRLQMYVDTVTITEGLQSNGSKVINTKQVGEGDCAPISRVDLVRMSDSLMKSNITLVTLNEQSLPYFDQELS